MPAVQRFFWPVFGRIQQCGSAEKAAHSLVFLVSSSEVAGVTGTYDESNAKPKRPSTLALDNDEQERACDLATALVSRAPTASAPRGVTGGTKRAEAMKDATRDRKRLVTIAHAAPCEEARQ
jgi:hypothetical protein